MARTKPYSDTWIEYLDEKGQAYLEQWKTLTKGVPTHKIVKAMNRTARGIDTALPSGPTRPTIVPGSRNVAAKLRLVYRGIMADEPRATVRVVRTHSRHDMLMEKPAQEILVLDDPDALAVVQAVEKHNLRGLYEANTDRIAHFKQRITDRGLTPKDVVIVILHVDDPTGLGGAIAEGLMPGHDWQAYRDRGETPIARGLAGRDGIQSVVDSLDDERASTKLRDFEGVAVVVVDHGVVEIFPA